MGFRKKMSYTCNWSGEWPKTPGRVFGTGLIRLYQLTLSGFPNAKGLEAIGSNLFLESPASGAPFTASPGSDGLGTVRQGYLEESSVDPVREITELIEAQRGYELNAKVISAADQILGATVQIR